MFQQNNYPNQNYGIYNDTAPAKYLPQRRSGLSTIIGIVVSVCFLLILGISAIIGIIALTGVFDSSTTTRRMTTTVTGTVPTQTECGMQQIAPSINGSQLNNARIINGQTAVSNSWPWMVSIRLRRSQNRVSGHLCGGVLIFDNIVLTAAHCVIDYSPSSLAIIVGLNNIRTSISQQNVFTASNYIYHVNYRNLVDDIAVIKLSSPVSASTNVGFVCLPTSSSEATEVLSKRVVATGWGSTTGSGSQASLASDLQQATLQVINGQSICSDGVSYDPSKIYCVNDPDKSKNSNVCFGDSGGSDYFYF
jgi:secreted trypsin-like serine protease